MAWCYTILGAGFRRTGETVHQMSNPWALQATVLRKADLLLQARERLALTQEVRHTGLLLCKLQWPPLSGLQGLSRNADWPEGKSAEEQDLHPIQHHHGEGS